MSAQSSAYSRRSWPSSVVTGRRRITATSRVNGCIFTAPSVKSGPAARCRRPRATNELRRGPGRLQLVGDRLEDRADAATGRGDRGDRHEGDQRHEERVLEQVLAFVVTDE